MNARWHPLPPFSRTPSPHQRRRPRHPASETIPDEPHAPDTDDDTHSTLSATPTAPGNPSKRRKTRKHFFTRPKSMSSVIYDLGQDNDEDPDMLDSITVAGGFLTVGKGAISQFESPAPLEAVASPLPPLSPPTKKRPASKAPGTPRSTARKARVKKPAAGKPTPVSAVITRKGRSAGKTTNLAKNVSPDLGNAEQPELPSELEKLDIPEDVSVSRGGQVLDPTAEPPLEPAPAPSPAEEDEPVHHPHLLNEVPSSVISSRLGTSTPPNQPTPVTSEPAPPEPPPFATSPPLTATRPTAPTAPTPPPPSNIDPSELSKRLIFNISTLPHLKDKIYITGLDLFPPAVDHASPLDDIFPDAGSTPPPEPVPKPDYGLLRVVGQIEMGLRPGIGEHWDIHLNYNFLISSQEQLDDAMADILQHRRLVHDIIFVKRGHEPSLTEEQVKRRSEDLNFWKGRCDQVEGIKAGLVLRRRGVGIASRKKTVKKKGKERERARRAPSRKTAHAEEDITEQTVDDREIRDSMEPSPTPTTATASTSAATVGGSLAPVREKSTKVLRISPAPNSQESLVAVYDVSAMAEDSVSTHTRSAAKQVPGNGQDNSRRWNLGEGSSPSGSAVGSGRNAIDKWASGASPSRRGDKGKGKRQAEELTGGSQKKATRSTGPGRKRRKTAKDNKADQLPDVPAVAPEAYQSNSSALEVMQTEVPTVTESWIISTEANNLDIQKTLVEDQAVAELDNTGAPEALAEKKTTTEPVLPREIDAPIETEPSVEIQQPSEPPMDAVLEALGVPETSGVLESLPGEQHPLAIIIPAPAKALELPSAAVTPETPQPTSVPHIEIVAASSPAPGTPKTSDLPNTLTRPIEFVLDPVIPVSPENQENNQENIGKQDVKGITDAQPIASPPASDKPKDPMTIKAIETEFPTNEKIMDFHNRYQDLPTEVESKAGGRELNDEMSMGGGAEGDHTNKITGERYDGNKYKVEDEERKVIGDGLANHIDIEGPNGKPNHDAEEANPCPSDERETYGEKPKFPASTKDIPRETPENEATSEKTADNPQRNIGQIDETVNFTAPPDHNHGGAGRLDSAPQESMEMDEPQVHVATPVPAVEITNHVPVMNADDLGNASYVSHLPAPTSTSASLAPQVVNTPMDISSSPVAGPIEDFDVVMTCNDAGEPEVELPGEPSVEYSNSETSSALPTIVEEDNSRPKNILVEISTTSESIPNAEVVNNEATNNELSNKKALINNAEMVNNDAVVNNPTPIDDFSVVDIQRSASLLLIYATHPQPRSHSPLVSTDLSIPTASALSPISTVPAIQPELPLEFPASPEVAVASSVHARTLAPLQAGPMPPPSVVPPPAAAGMAQVSQRPEEVHAASQPMPTPSARAKRTRGTKKAAAKDTAKPPKEHAKTKAPKRKAGQRGGSKKPVIPLKIKHGESSLDDGTDEPHSDSAASNINTPSSGNASNWPAPTGFTPVNAPAAAIVSPIPRPQPYRRPESLPMRQIAMKPPGASPKPRASSVDLLAAARKQTGLAKNAKGKGAAMRLASATSSPDYLNAPIPAPPASPLNLSRGAASRRLPLETTISSPIRPTQQAIDNGNHVAGAVTQNHVPRPAYRPVIAKEIIEITDAPVAIATDKGKEVVTRNKQAIPADSRPKNQMRQPQIQNITTSTPLQPLQIITDSPATLVSGQPSQSPVNHTMRRTLVPSRLRASHSNESLNGPTGSDNTSPPTSVPLRSDTLVARSVGLERTPSRSSGVSFSLDTPPTERNMPPTRSPALTVDTRQSTPLALPPPKSTPELECKKFQPVVDKDNFLYWDPSMGMGGADVKPLGDTSTGAGPSVHISAVGLGVSPFGFRRGPLQSPPPPLQPLSPVELTSSPPTFPVAAPSNQFSPVQPPKEVPPHSTANAFPNSPLPKNMVFQVSRYAGNDDEKIVIYGHEFLAPSSSRTVFAWDTLVTVLGNSPMRFNDTHEALVVNMHHVVDDDDSLNEGVDFYHETNKILIARTDALGRPPKELLTKIKHVQKELQLKAGQI